MSMRLKTDEIGKYHGSSYICTSSPVIQHCIHTITSTQLGDLHRMFPDRLSSLLRGEIPFALLQQLRF